MTAIEPASVTQVPNTPQQSGGGTTPNIDAATNTPTQNRAPATATPANPQTASAVFFPDNWKDGLGDELKADPTIAKFTNVPELAKSYLQIQKTMGKDKIAIPDKHATDDDWKGVFQKLGLPEKSESYEFEAPKDAFKPEFVKAFKEQAFQNNILPKQAEKLLGWYADLQKQQNTQAQEASRVSLAQAQTKLKEEWGEAFDSRKLKAETAAKRFFNEEGISFLERTGLHNNLHFARAFAAVGELLAEHGIKGDPASYTGLTPEDAKSKISEINGNKAHPYWNKSHANHQKAVDEMALYYRSAYPE
jgi:hypothetical protein